MNDPQVTDRYHDLKIKFQQDQARLKKYEKDPRFLKIRALKKELEYHQAGLLGAKDESSKFELIESIAELEATLEAEINALEYEMRVAIAP